MPVFKTIVRRVRDWKKNAVGSEYTRYFDSAEDMAKSMAGYAKYYGPEVLRAMGWGTVTAGTAAITGLTAVGGLMTKKPVERLSALSGTLLSGTATAMSAELLDQSIRKIAQKSRDLSAFKREAGVSSMAEAFKKERMSKKSTVDTAGKELVYNHFEK